MDWESEESGFLTLSESFLSLSLSFPIWKIIRLDLMISKHLSFLLLSSNDL